MWHLTILNLSKKKSEIEINFRSSLKVKSKSLCSKLASFEGLSKVESISQPKHSKVLFSVTSKPTLKKTTQKSARKERDQAKTN